MLKKRGPYKLERRAVQAPKTPEEIGHFLKEWRLCRDMTQEQLADGSGLSTGSISAMERGDQYPSMETLAALANALDLSRGMLLDTDPNIDLDRWKSFSLTKQVKGRGASGRRK